LTYKIGIRKVFGASVLEITILLIKGIVMMTVLVSLLSWPIAWYLLSKWLDNFVYRINPDAAVLVLSGSIVLGLVVFTASFKTIKSALANPSDTLRYE
jgi:putative ABC transport system permease protein